MIYVISDLHGYPFNKFEELLQEAKFTDNDFLFVLGDVIDRGTDGIKYLQWFMLQNNAELILGNHEAMMLTCSFLFDEVDEDSIERLSVEELELLMNWQRNGASQTLESLHQMRPTERKYIIEYLIDAPLYEYLTVEGKDYLLTHSGLGHFENDKILSDYSYDDILWNRPSIGDRYFENITTIFGHTPTFCYGEKYKGKIIKTDTWVNIDVGAGYGYAPIMLRLDDMVQFSVI